jgi:hypothetical protein
VSSVGVAPTGLGGGGAFSGTSATATPKTWWAADATLGGFGP